MRKRDPEDPLTAFKEHGKLIRALFDLSTDPMLIADDGFTLVDANSAACDLFGLTREELVGRPAIEVFGPSAGSANGPTGIVAGTLFVRRRDGRKRLAECIARANFARDRHLWVLRDVTGGPPVAEALVESEGRFRELAGNISEVFWMASATRPEILYVSPAYSRVWGRSVESLMEDPLSFLDAIHDEDRPRIISAFASQRQGERTIEEYRIVRGDGTMRWIRDRAFPIRGADGAVSRVAGIAEDITERREAEIERAHFLERETEARASAESAERRAAFLAEASSALASSLDYETTLASVARLSVPKLADYSFIDMVQHDGSIKRLAMIHRDPRKEELLREMRRRYPADKFRSYGISHVLTTGQASLIPQLDPELLLKYSFDEQYLEMLRALGPRSYMVVPLTARNRILGAISFVSSDSGRVYGEADFELAKEIGRLAAIAVDNARLYQEAQEASKIKDEFLATVSHELRTPLNSILGWLYLMRTGRLDRDAFGRAVETIERNARAQAQLIEDLLDISRIITGKLRLNVRRIDLSGIVREAIESVRPAAEARSITLDVDFQAPLPRLSGDPDRLQQVVWNLLSNAIKFTPPGGRVAVKIEPAPTTLRLIVRDTGKGISTDFLPHVFERFRQADSSTTRAHGGLGIGLAIVRHVVEMHGGSVHAESEGEARGTTISVELPTASDFEIENPQSADRQGSPRPAPARQPDQPLLNTRPPRLSGLKLLVVDDEPDTLEMVQTLLSQFGSDVRTAKSAAEALVILKDWRPDLLISDVGMPCEDGIELIKRVRANSSMRELPAVALTAYARTEDRIRVLAAGYQMHVSKPVEPEELIAAILEASESPR